MPVGYTLRSEVAVSAVRVSTFVDAATFAGHCCNVATGEEVRSAAIVSFRGTVQSLVPRVVSLHFCRSFRICAAIFVVA